MLRLPHDLTEREREIYLEHSGKLIDGGMPEERADGEARRLIQSRRERKRAEFDASELEKGAAAYHAREVMSIQTEVEADAVFDGYRHLIERGLARAHINSFDPTEIGQAKAAARYLDGMIRYTDGAGWLAYDSLSGCFRADIGRALLKRCLNMLAQERYDLRSAGEPKEFARYAEKAVTSYGVNAVAEILKSELFVGDGIFGRDPRLLNCQGETYDLRSGHHGPSVPEHFHSKTTGFRPLDGDCPVFRKFLGEITLGDAETAAWLMRWFGYCLTGDIGAAYFVNFHGGGRNGKGALIHVMCQIMGSYAGEIDQSVVVDTGRGGNVKNALAELAGLRAGFAADVPPGSLNISDLKKLTGGDLMVAERKYCNPFQFRPVVKLTFSSNPVLRLSDTGQSVKSRLRYVPFNLSVAGREDTTLEDRILAEGPQILAWLIREAGEYLKNPGPKGFPPCAAIDAASEEYIKSEDTIGQFLEERTEEAPYEQVKARALYEAYKAWCGDNKRMTSTTFGRKLAERGMEKQRGNQGQYYKDIRIRGENG